MKLDTEKFYLEKFNNDYHLFDYYSIYGEKDLFEISNEEFTVKLYSKGINRGISKATITVLVEGHPSGYKFYAEMGLGALKDVIMYNKSENGELEGKFKFGKRGKNYFIIPLKNKL